MANIEDNFGAEYNLLKQNDCKRFNVDLSVMNNKSTAQTLANGVSADIVFTEADTIDHGNWHNPAVNPEDFICPETALYLVKFKLNFAAITADMSLEISVGNADFYETKIIQSGANGVLTFETITLLTAGQALTLNIEQNGIVAGIDLDSAMIMVIKIGQTLTM